jgi:Bacterial TSP3 repeat
VRCPSLGQAGADAVKFSYMSDPRLDSDHDGMNDGDELLAGTDPLNPNDAFRIVDASGAIVGSKVLISWDGKIGRVYDVQTNTNLISGSWAYVSGYTNLIGIGSIMSYTGTVSGIGDFYRVKVKLGL